MVVMKDADGAPLKSNNELRETITVEIAPQRAADHPNVFQDAAVRLVEHEGAVLIAENSRTGRLRIPSSLNPAADKQIQVAVAIQIPHRKWPNARVAGGDRLAPFTRRRIKRLHGAPGRFSIFVISRAGEQNWSIRSARPGNDRRLIAHNRG